MHILLSEGITNYKIAELVYGSTPESNGMDLSFEYPDFEKVHCLMNTRKNMTLVNLWNRYSKNCHAEEKKFYQYSQFCELYGKWCEDKQSPR